MRQLPGLRLPIAALFLNLLLAPLVPAQRDLRIKPINANKRWALVVGNNAYQGAPLKNAINDAKSMEGVLKDLGFDTEVLVDINAKGLSAAVNQFASRLGAGDIAVFYYAGHGVQMDGENYLIPTDFAGQDEADLKFQSIAASWVQEKLDRTGAQLKIIILDACRNNPFRASRGGPGGLAQMQGGRGSFIAFATAAGKVANDNPSSSNGLFTRHLVDALKEPGLTLDDVFNRVREKVDKASGGSQLPYIYSGVIGQFVFRVEVAVTVAGPTNPGPSSGGPVSGGPVTPSQPDSFKILNSVISREPTPSGIAPRIADAENEFLTTDPHAVVMYTHTAGHLGDKMRGEWRNPFGAVSLQFDYELRTDRSGFGFYYLPIAGRDPSKMPGNWELRIFHNDQGVAILPFRIAAPPESAVRFTRRTVLPRATVLVPYKNRLRAEGGVPPYRWSATGALPAGLELTPEGELTGLPERRGSFRISVKAEDKAGNSVMRNLGLGIGMVPPNVHVSSHSLTGDPANQDVCTAGGVQSEVPKSQAWLWLSFKLDGHRAGETGMVDWLGPSGDVVFSQQIRPRADAEPQRCFQVRIPVSGARIAQPLGDWHARIFWLDGELLEIPFHVAEAK